jgi:hypothetical protein
MRTPIMNRALLGVLICLICGASPRNDGAVLLHGAAHCLAAKDFLPPISATKLTFGYLLDEKSYPGEKMLYVVNFPNSSQPDGLVFTIFLTKTGGRQNFDIQNNARFTLSMDGDQGVSFISPALGGIWTQQHLVSAIKEIEKLPRSTVLTKDMLSIDSLVSCDAYTDPQPQQSVK